MKKQTTTVLKDAKADSSSSDDGSSSDEVNILGLLVSLRLQEFHMFILEFFFV